ncbi:uncharacterized protein LOC142785325 [Rhipicephalus microplus]|uniref:uncharacterized protein LOC142785325 n=1 Tax=Rhipicephalus microplus TaxID=6941 RepID=UPI003F6C39F3
MPGHCCVPGCRGNYDGEKTVRVFTFPADADRRRRWLKAIPRADFEPGKRSVVCERHFRESDILTSSKYVDSKTGKVVEAKLKIARLRSDAVPSVFPNCPAYLSAPAATSREAPAEKRMRLEAASLREAIANSLETHEEEETKHKFDTFQALLECLPQMKLSNFWSVISRPACIHFLNLALEDAPRVLLSITVLEDLTVKVHCQDVQLTTIDGIGAIPHEVNDIRCLTRLLDSVESLHGELSCKHEDKIEGLLKLAFSLLEDASNCELADVERLNAIRFLKEQVSLLLVRHSKQSRYSPEFLVLSSILFTISPHAYRFLRSTGNVRLPHPSTIRRVCNSYNVSPEAEQQGASFLSYAKKLVTTMKEHEKIVVLMMDEIHLQPYFDYKGGTIVGAASNSPNAAKTAHVFMMQSLLSSEKNVVHILPVERINAEELHTLLRSIITQLENVGLRIIAVITDNNSINRKTMSLFGAPCKLQSVYPHPADPDRPLFFLIDPVHLMKCVRNNWLNQRNSGTCMFFPSATESSVQPPILTALFRTLRELHLKEQGQLIKSAPALTTKSLNPSNMERQNVKLALKIFNPSTAAALRACGPKLQLEHVAGTAEFLELITKWWSIVNVKTCNKGIRLRDELQSPIASVTSPQVHFLLNIVEWLDLWQSLRFDAGVLTRETHSALRLTTETLVKVAEYCLNELNFDYVLLGKFQTDSLEERFGKYRQLSGAQYHISIRQVYESERKLRLQNVLELPEMEAAADSVAVNNAVLDDFEIEITDEDYDVKVPNLPAITYVAGYCAHAAFKKLLCMAYKESLMLDDDIEVEGGELIKSMTRGGLKFPQPAIINAVVTAEIVLDKLRSEQHAQQFHALPNQKEALLALTHDAINNNVDFDVCENGHSPQLVMHYVLSAAANTLLNNLCKRKNDQLVVEKAARDKERKLKTLKK